MINKRYQIKCYEKDGTFKFVINEKLIEGQIVFEEVINGGQGGMNLTLALDYYNNDFSQTDIIEVREVSEEQKTITGVYTGIIEEIKRVQNEKGEKITLVIYGHFTALNDILFDDGSGLTLKQKITDTNGKVILTTGGKAIGTTVKQEVLTDGLKVFTRNTNAGTIIKNIIDYFNILYGTITTQNLNGNLFYYDDSIEDGPVINIEFNYNNCLQAIKKVVEKADYYFYIDYDGKVIFKQKPTTATHRLTFGQDINEISNDDTKKELVNKVYVERNGGVYKSYEDTTSITLYGKKEKKISKTDIQDETTQDEFGVSYLAENGTIKKEIKIIINPRFSGEIKPGETIKTLNTNNPIDNLQVVKTQKGPLQDVIYLDRYTSLGKAISEA